jgi:hypothetical protein
MTHSYYDDSTHLIPGRVAGYTPTADGYVNADYVSMTHAYAAGALAASVDDLARWDAALYTNKLVKATTLRRAFKAYTLKNGQSSGYGYGWSIANYAGHPIEQHDGGINGFNTIVMRLPADKVYIAILTNNGNNPVSLNDLALTIATLVIGQRYQDPPAITLPAATLAAYEGVYLLDEQVEVVVRSEGTHLSVTTPGEPATVFTPFAADEFFGDAAYLRLKFVKNNASAVTALRVQRYFGPWRLAPKLDKPLPALPEAIEVDPATLADYVGQYEAPGLSLAVTLEGDSLMVTPAGQEAAELVPTAPAQFAIPAFNAQIEFVRAADGAVSRLVIYMGGQEIPADKAK